MFNDNSGPGVLIRLRTIDVENFGAEEAGNFVGDDLPIADDTEIYVDLGGGTCISTTIGQWRRLVDAADRGIQEIPNDRAKKRDRERRWAEQRAAREAVTA